jgi:hypothetical protein
MSENNSCSSKPNSIEFRTVEVPNDKSIITRKIGMIQSFAMSLTSRGIMDKKINKATKQLRVLSCFGNKHLGGVVPPCEHLKDSKTEGQHFCGGCGCGDRQGTWLIANGNDYSKLDYPRLNCPITMPGFTNYKPSVPDEAIAPITRKYYIENIEFEELNSMSVSLPDMPEQMQKAMEEAQKKSLAGMTSGIISIPPGEQLNSQKLQ